MELTKQEFSDLTGNSSLEQDQINKYLVKAGLQLGLVTNGVYEDDDYTNDRLSNYPYFMKRATAYKQALALTVEFMANNDVATSADLNGNAKATLSIGDMHVQGYDLNGVNASNTAVPDEAYNLLARFGLVYRGGFS